MNLQPHPFTLRQLQYVIAVADLLSFRRAAEACFVSQPALSAQVAQVEEMLGVVLFERNHKRVMLTPSGELLLPRIRRLVVDAHALTESARRAADPLTSTLRLGVIPTIAPYLLPQLTPALRATFPQLQPLWTEEKTPVLVARLAAGHLDAALLALEADLGDVEHALISEDPFLLAAPLEHPLAAATAPVTVEQLQPVPLLLLEEGHCLRSQILSFCARADIHEMAFRATSLPTLVQMVAGGAGLTLLPRLAAPTEAARARLALRDLAPPVPSRTIALVWRSRSPLGPSLQRLAEIMRGAAVEVQSAEASP